MNRQEVPELGPLDQMDREAVERILEAVSDVDHQIRRARRNLSSRVRAVIADHRERVIRSTKPQGPAKVKAPVDYDKLIAILQRQPLTYEIIKRETGLNDRDIAGVIYTLSLRCALFDPAKGIYELLR